MKPGQTRRAAGWIIQNEAGERMSRKVFRTEKEAVHMIWIFYRTAQVVGVRHGRMVAVPYAHRGSLPRIRATRHKTVPKKDWAAQSRGKAVVVGLPDGTFEVLR